MNEYIDREAAIKAIYERCSGEHWEDILRSLPAADVHPIVHGEVLYDAKHDKETCSVCGCEYIMVWYKETTNLDSPILSSDNMRFCPNCGADMRKEKQNENK